MRLKITYRIPPRDNFLARPLALFGLCEKFQITMREVRAMVRIENEQARLRLRFSRS